MSPPVCPLLTVDAILLVSGGVVLVSRGHEPLGWALPGGFVDRGESVEDACVREVREETGLSARLIRQFHVYSDPARDARGHTVSVCFVAEADGEPMGGDDAAVARVFSLAALPKDLCFDHGTILDDYLSRRY